MAGVTYREAKQRYHRAFWPAMAIYVAICLGGALFLNIPNSPALWMRLAYGLGCTLPVLVVLAAMFRFASEADEYFRLAQFKAMAFGGMVTAGAAITIGFLELMEVVPDVWLFFMCPLFFIAYGLGGRLFKAGCLP